MTSDSMNRFEQDHLKRWWETTRYYLLADMESLPGAAAVAEDGWSPPQTESHGGRKRFIARVRGRLLRSIKRGGKDDPLRELESAFQQQITFIARHPDVPRRLLSWLAQDGDPGLQRRVRMVIGCYATRLAQIIARAEQKGLIRADIKPHAAAISLVGVIQKLVLETYATPKRGESFLRKATEAFALYLAALAVPSKGKQAGNF
ncbi:MAG: hypothetical protein Q8N54_06450 [Sulfurimicrobium sp.]|jgi:hypothetical protein|nr:hypothetical protein [Sulfurimicrobium sp.]